MNEKLCRELNKLFKDCLNNIEKHMNREEHKLISMASEYRETSRLLNKMCDLLEIFAWVNSEILK